MKTLKYWENDGSCFSHYVKAGDEIDEAMFYHFLGVVPPIVQEWGFFLMGEPSTQGPLGEMLYMKFTDSGGKYTYAGLYTTDGKSQEELNG